MKEMTLAALQAAADSTMIAFGLDAQMIKTCEELGELTTQLCKKLNGSPTTNAAIVDEVADVLIMAFQMRHVFGAEAVDERIIYKLDRTMEFIRNRAKPAEQVEGNA